MSKRLQVLLEPKEFKFYQGLARKNGLPLGEWVRRSLRRTAVESSTKNPETKIKALNQALHCNFPTADIDQMLAEIERGYVS